MDIQRVALLVSSFNEAPTDLQTEIFARLPVEFVYSCRLVCKQWNDLLSSNDFLSKWAEVSLNRKQPRLVLSSNILGMPWMAFCFCRRTWINSCFTLSFMGDWMLPTRKCYCNQSVPGLILVMRRNSLDGRVCNPYTKEFVDIPALHERHYIVFDQMNKTDASYRVVAIGINQRYANGRIKRQMVQIYKPSQKIWNIAGYIPEELVVEKTISYNGSFYSHCHTREDETNGIGVFTIPDGSSIAPKPIPILFAPFPEIVLNWIRHQDRTECWPHIISCGSRVLLVAAKWMAVQVEEAGGGGEEESAKPEIIIWELITEVEGHPSNSPWVEIARMPSSFYEEGMEKDEFYWSCIGNFIGAGDYVCFVPSYHFSLPTEIVDVATYNLIDHRWDWLPILSTSRGESSPQDFPKAMSFVPNPHAKVE